MCWFSSDETEFQTENSEDKKKEKYLKKKPTYSKGSQQATPETEDKRGNKNHRNPKGTNAQKPLFFPASPPTQTNRNKTRHRIFCK